MDLSALAEVVRTARAVVAVGSRTQWAVGGDLAAGTGGQPAVEIRAPHGITKYEPADMTVTVGAATTFAEVAATLAAHGQECPLDPEDASATVGGLVACGLSGLRRLRHGPLRDHVLEVRFVTADGRLVKGGGPTVKNVTGYDLPRLFVGSLGTLGVITQVTLRCRPRPPAARWLLGDRVPDRLVRPSAVVWDGARVRLLVEGSETDVAAQVEAMGATVGPSAAPVVPAGPHRGRISVAPSAARPVADALVGTGDIGVLAELGVGTVHVATGEAAALTRARAVAQEHGGWMLRVAGGDGIDGFGRALPNHDLMRRIKRAFDPTGKLAPGRLPL